MRRRRSRRKSSKFETIGNWISLILVLGAVGAAGFVWWRWEFQERRFDKLIVEVAGKYGVDPCLVKAVMRRESRFDPWVYGRHGEIGLMQVTEGAGAAWARAVGRQEFGRSLLWDERVNVEAGSWYLARALGRWRGRGAEELRVAVAVAEYNAGYGNVVRWLRASNGGRTEGMGLGNAAGAVGDAGVGSVGGGGVSGVAGGKKLAGSAGLGNAGGGGGELTAEEFVGGITWPGVRDYVEDVMESWRVYRERGRL
jgi:Transglycosylase SLT domain